MEVKNTNGNWALVVALAASLVVIGMAIVAGGCDRKPVVAYVTKEEFVKLKDDVDAIKKVVAKPPVANGSANKPGKTKKVEKPKKQSSAFNWLF